MNWELAAANSDSALELAETGSELTETGSELTGSLVDLARAPVAVQEQIEEVRVALKSVAGCACSRLSVHAFFQVLPSPSLYVRRSLWQLLDRRR